MTIQEKMKNFFNSPRAEKIVTKTLICVGVLVAILFVFLAGEEVGFKRAQFSSHFGGNYVRIFGDRNGMMGEMPPFDNESFPNVHGATGKIVKIELPAIVIAGSDGTEKIINISNDSLVRLLRDTASSSDLKVGDMITVLGSPEANGTIDAKLIRIMPATLNTQTATTTKI